MGEENNPLWGIATIFINGEKLGTLGNVSKTITMENKQKKTYTQFKAWMKKQGAWYKFVASIKRTKNQPTNAKKLFDEWGIHTIKWVITYADYVGSFCFWDNLHFRFMNWYSTEEQQPKFKVGDLVRFNNDKVMKILDVWCEYTPEGYCVGFRYNCNGKHYSDAMLEPYSPKEGEFAFVTTKFTPMGYVFHKKDGTDITYHSYAWIEQRGLLFPENACCDDSEIIILRPATKDEKQTLIKAVEDRFNKTYCEKTKEWVEVKEKSDVKADKVEQGTLPRTASFELGSISLADLQSIAELAGWKPSNVERFRQITKDMADLYERKNKDYGSAFSKGVERRGFGSAVDRLYDKVDRLNQLLVENKTAEVKDESVIDTLKDLANYSIMTILEVEKKKVDK